MRNPIEQEIAYACAKRYIKGGRLDEMILDTYREHKSSTSMEEVRMMFYAIDAYEDSREPDGAPTANP